MPILMEFSTEGQAVEAGLDRLQRALVADGPLCDVRDDEILTFIDVHQHQRAQREARPAAGNLGGGIVTPPG